MTQYFRWDRRYRRRARGRRYGEEAICFGRPDRVVVRVVRDSILRTLSHDVPEGGLVSFVIRLRGGLGGQGRWDGQGCVGGDQRRIWRCDPSRGFLMEQRGPPRRLGRFLRCVLFVFETREWRGVFDRFVGRHVGLRCVSCFGPGGWRLLSGWWPVCWGESFRFRSLSAAGTVPLLVPVGIACDGGCGSPAEAGDTIALAFEPRFDFEASGCCGDVPLFSVF